MATGLLEAVLHEPRTVPGGSLIRLLGVPWHLYRELRDLDENDSVRMTFSAGALWLMSPSRCHERMSRQVSLMISQ